ncbi:thiamine-phosphate kinase [soil metagenome]
MKTPCTEKLFEIGEDALVSRITRKLPSNDDVVAGAGDDCAIVKSCGQTWQILLKTDCVVEGVHFLPDAPPDQVGWKAMARVVSDMAAMAGIPLHAMVTLILPPDHEVARVEQLYEGLRRCAERYGVSIVGGETSTGPLVIISVSMMGKVNHKRCLLRTTAEPGDAIFVTGGLGGSIHGKHLKFEPRLKEAHWLAARIPVHAMMDLSDGLGKDLPRMAAAAGLGFVIEEEKIPANKGCTQQQAWSDGEDYELLFSVSADNVRRLQSAWKRQFPQLSLTCIGRFVKKGKGKAPRFQPRGWEHFKSNP